MSANVIGPLERRDSKTLCAGQSSTSFQDQERVGTLGSTQQTASLLTSSFHIPFSWRSVYLQFKAISSAIRTLTTYLIYIKWA